jgi:hypothetical protein
MKAIFKLSVLILAFAATSCGGKFSSNKQQGLTPYFDLDWAKNSLWDDGQAEVALYDASRVIYNKPRYFEYAYILVKEDFNAEFGVKTDDYGRKDLYPVMKVNQFADIPTENYPYHFLTSIFFKRENPIQAHKMTYSSQEWCGNTFKLFQEKGSQFAYTYHSYWDGQGDATQMIDASPLWEDQLPYTLRALKFTNGLKFSLSLYGSQINSRADLPTAYQAHFSIAQLEAIDSLPGGLPMQPVWVVNVKLDEEKANQYVFTQAYPNILIEMTGWDGRKLRLREYKRNKYWERG